MHNFVDLQPYGENQQLRMIVETPCATAEDVVRSLALTYLPPPRG